MPAFNQFQHQLYPTEPAITPQLLNPHVTEAEEFDFTRLHAELGVSQVILVHGTFMGNDPFGISDMLNRIAGASSFFSEKLNGLADRLLENTRPFTTNLVGDLGNYNDATCRLFQQLVGDDPHVELLEPTWSSQNHHFARADLAVRLLHRLFVNPPGPGETALLWGHSHAGNAFAILTNLLANDREAVEHFFDTVMPQSDGSAPSAEAAEPHWTAVRRMLAQSATPHPLAEQILIAGFGTPVRYGWDTNGCRRIVHVLHHRLPAADAPYRTHPLFPPHMLNNVVNAKWGDWVQAFAIAGTDVSSLPLKAVNDRLTALLQRNLPVPEHGLDTRLIVPASVRNTCVRWKAGTRCHTDGLNLLVDYQPSGALSRLRQPIENSMLGHGVATSLVWLPVHLKMVIEGMSAS